MPLNEFSLEFGDRVHDLLWKQWVSLGVLGHGVDWSGSPVDPDALLAFSCEYARRDQRLFDAIMEWMERNARYINVSRVRGMLAASDFLDARIFYAMAEVTADSNLASKYVSKAKEVGGGYSVESLFKMADGTDLPSGRSLDSVFKRWGYLRNEYLSRGTSRSFDPRNPVNVLLRLRALLGVNARCEFLLYLLLNESGSPRAMAKSCGYQSATASKALSEMADSGLVSMRKDGRHSLYRLENRSPWMDLLLEDKAPLSWINWVEVFAALGRIDRHMKWNVSKHQTEMEQASALRRFIEKDVIAPLEKVGVDWHLGDTSLYRGEELLPFFMARMEKFLTQLGV